MIQTFKTSSKAKLSFYKTLPVSLVCNLPQFDFNSVARKTKSNLLLKLPLFFSGCLTDSPKVVSVPSVLTQSVTAQANNTGMSTRGMVQQNTL